MFKTSNSNRNMIILPCFLMKEICPPTNASHEEDSKALISLRVGLLVGVAKYSSFARKIHQQFSID